MMDLLRNIVFTHFTSVIFILSVFAETSSDISSKSKEKILVEIGDKKITVNEFIQRAEYTIRPPYCKGNGGIDKKIILNSLIAEKLMALEVGSENQLNQNIRFQNFILGRQEQAMRQILAYEEGAAKVSLDTTEIKKLFSLAGRKYQVNYITAPLSKSNRKIKITAENILEEFDQIDSLSTKEISWDSPEIQIIHDSLFSNFHQAGDLIGPINLPDSTILYLKIKSWTDRVALTESAKNQRLADVKEHLLRTKSAELYNQFVLNIMHGKQVQFNPLTYRKLLKALHNFYFVSNQEMKDAFLDLSFEKEGPNPLLNKTFEKLENIKSYPLFTCGNQTWSVEDLETEMQKHPLVFRKRKFSPQEFPEQLKFAIVDLIRDKYLTEIAYQRGFDKLETVKQYVQMWHDASISLNEKHHFVQNIDTTGKSWLNVIEEYFNPYIEILLNKYSKDIKINIDEFNKINLTRIDMVALQTDVPYPIYVPSFPMLTTKNELDFGIRMDF
ncbi:MAG: hypothetical protein HXY50_02675 [Ignavibacteriaceae bacterium]|nr:hypothetical protein [Ignavibacteriaceae bacterium]